MPDSNIAHPVVSIRKSSQLQRIPLYFALSGAGYLFLQIVALGYGMIQVMLLLLFIIGSVFEYKASKHPFFTLPPAIFSLYMFVNIFFSGVTYFLLNLEETTQFIVGDESVVRGSFYTLVATQMLWIFFYSIPETRLKMPSNTGIRRPSLFLLYALAAISLLAFVLGVQLSLYGYAADSDELGYLYYIRFAVTLGWLAIILMVIHYYKFPEKRIQLYVLLAISFLTGILSGSKSMAAMPFLFVIVALYFTGTKIRAKYLAAIAISIILAYTIIEPFRAHFDTEGDTYTTRDVSGLGELFSDAFKSGGNDANYLAAFAERMSYVTPLAKTIEYADDWDYYHSEEWDNLPLSPLHGIIPRLVWESKPLANFGAWASVHIFGLTETTHTGITPQGYAYLVYRLPGILIFFALYGVMQKLLFNMLYLSKGLLPFYILFVLDIGYPSVVPSHYIAGTVKMLVSIVVLTILLNFISRSRNAA